jgi:hypothetical protein
MGAWLSLRVTIQKLLGINMNNKNDVTGIFLGVASENGWYLGDNKSVIILIPSQ